MFIDTIDLNCNRPIRLNLSMKSKILYIEDHGPMLSKIVYENREVLKVPIGAARLEELFNQFNLQALTPVINNFSPRDKSPGGGGRNILDSQDISPRSTKPLEDSPTRKTKKHNEET